MTDHLLCTRVTSKPIARFPLHADVDGANVQPTFSATTTTASTRPRPCESLASFKRQIIQRRTHGPVAYFQTHLGAPKPLSKQDGVVVYLSHRQPYSIDISVGRLYVHWSTTFKISAYYHHHVFLNQYSRVVRSKPIPDVSVPADVFSCVLYMAVRDKNTSPHHPTPPRPQYCYAIVLLLLISKPPTRDLPT